MSRPASFGNAKGIKPRFVLILLLCTSLTIGCFHGPAHYRPRNWVGTPINMESIATPPDQSLLQVIIVYGPAWGHHSALRLVCQDRPVLFWDPGGGYGVSDPEVVRDKDLIKTNAPDLKRYLQFTWERSSVEVEVFEWVLTQEQALELYEVLVHGGQKNHDARGFTTFVLGGFCTVKLSDFLRRFATEVMFVPKSFFFPEDLARVLYSQSPTRVLSLHRGNVPKIYNSLNNIDH